MATPVLAQQTVYWRNGAGVANWWDGANPWYRNCDGWWIARPDYNVCNNNTTVGANELHFDNGSDLTMNINGAYFQVTRLLFDNGTGARTMTAASGGGIDMRASSGTVKIENNDADTQTIVAPIILYTDTEINPAAGDLTFRDNIYFKGNAVNVWGSARKTLNLFSVLNRDGGDGGLNVKDHSFVVITNNNNITGNLWAEKGVIRLYGSTNAMGNGQTINIGTNAAVELDYSGGEVLRTNNWNVYGTGTNGAGAIKKISTSGNVTIPGLVILQQDAAIRSDGGSLIISNVISGTPVLSKVGTGTLQLSSNNTYSGKTHISNGVVVIIATNGLGTAAGDTTVIGGAALEVRGVSSYEPLSINGHGINGAGAVYNDLTTAGGTLTNTIALGSASAVGGSGLLTLSGVISGANQLTKVGTGTNVLSGNNTFSGSAIISNGVVRISHTNALGDVSAVTDVKSGASLEYAMGNVAYAPEPLTIAGQGVTNGGALRSVGSGVAIVVGKITLTADARIQAADRGFQYAASATYTLTNDLAGFTLSLGGDNNHSMNAGSTFTNATKTSGSGAIVKEGLGIFLLRPSSDMTGSIALNAGEIQVSANASGTGLPAGGTLTMAASTKLSASTGARTVFKNMVINGGVGLAENGANDMTFNGTLDLGGADRTVTNSNAVTINGQISNGGIIKTGTGVMTINSNNTYSGQTLVMAGELIHRGTNTSSQFGVGSSGYLYGQGSLGTLTITGQVSAGTASNTVGSLRASALNLQNNGRLQVNFANAGNMNGTAGTDWDIVTVSSGSGTYTVNAVDGSDFVIALKGTPTFNTSLGYTNIIVDAGTATSFVANKFTVNSDEFNGGALGGGTFSVDADSGNLRLIFTPALVATPDILVQGLSITIPDADTTPDYTDDTDFGDLLVVGGTLTKTYTITNSGSAALGIGNVYTNTAGTADFIVTAQPGSFNLAVGATTTFQVQFNPTNSGLRFADLEFTNNVSGAKNPYTFRVQGTGTFVEVAASGLGNNIPDGDAVPTTSDGTDFGSIALTGGTQPRTFVITNSGNRTLTITGGITTSGTHAAEFQITTAPSATIAPSGSTSFVVTFDPNGVGTRSATINFSNNDDNFSDGLTESSFDFAVQGLGVAPAMSNFPTALSFTSVLGSSPATQTFSITNVGLGSMTWALTTNVTWLSVSNVTGSAAAGAGQVHTAYVGVLAGQVAGTSNATITITSGEATNSPLITTVQWTITAIPNPSAQTATADGNEMVRLRWTKDVGYNVMVIHKGTNAPSVPANGTTYSLGHVFADGSRVIAFNTTTNHLEHIVAAGSTNFYAFYSMNNSYYSPGVSASVTMGLYGSGERVDQGGYTNGVSLSGLNGGPGWSGAWSTSGSGTWQIQTNFSDTANEIPMMPTMSGYPATAANRMKIDGLGSDQTAFATRSFTAVTTGNLYVASMVAFRYYGGGGANSRYMGISLYNGGAEEAFIGRAGGNNVLAIDSTGSAKTESGYTISGTEVGAGGNTGNVYLIVTKYDFTANKVYTKAYYRTDAVDASEPTWTITNTPSPAITSIDTIRIGGGAYGGNSMGGMWFDEVRVAQSWTELLRLTEPVASAYSINGGANVTDGQITGGTYSVVYDFYDTAGITNTASLPNYDIWNSTGTRILTNQTFASKIANGGPATMRASNTTHVGASGAVVVLGVYTSRWTAANSNGVQISNSDSLSNGTKTVFTVVDDDTTGPAFTGMRANGGTSLTDGQLFTGGWTFTGLVQDAESGIDADGSAGADPYPPFYDILNPSGTEAVNNGVFDTTPADGAGLSSAANLTESGMAAVSAANNALGIWTARVFAANNDNDRTGDRSGSTNDTAITVTDDDTSGPVHGTFTGLGRTLAGGTYTNVELGSGLVVTGLVTDAQSGVYAGTSNRWTLFRGGATVNNGSFTALFADGTAVSSNGQLTATLASGDVLVSGSYTLRVFSVNYDLDRAGGVDMESTTVDYEFTVVAATEDLDVYGNAVLIPDGDTSPAYADHTDYGDVLVSGGTLTRTFTITNSGANVVGIGNVTTNAGGNPTNFVVTVQPAASLAIGATTTFQVLFNPSAGGEAFADIQFTSTLASAKNPYTFRVQGTGTFVEVAASGLGNNIADGDASPTATDGTDFGSVGLSPGTQTRTFVITNSGNRTLTISGGITTSGTHAAEFQITTAPSATIAPSGSTSFVVTFDPTAVGLRTATINFSNNDDDFSDGLNESSFDFAVQGLGVAPAMSNFPTSLSFSSVLGTAPATQTFSITNSGLGTLTYSLTTNVTWLSVSNVTGSALAGAGQVHTAYVGVLAGQVPGTSNATITITSSDATNSPLTIAVAWTISAIPSPTAQTAGGDGAELVRLNWTKDPSYNVMIVQRGTNASTAPAQGTLYNVGDALGGGTVIFKGGGAYLDQVVAQGTTNHYAFYSFSGNFYSVGVTAIATTTVYQAGEIVEQFAYTNGASLNGLIGGQGWTNAWNAGSGYGLSTTKFSSITGYPVVGGNVLTGTSVSAYREFAEYTSGKLYVSYNFRVSNGSGYAGLSFFNNSSEQIFFGESGLTVNNFAVDGGGGNAQNGGSLNNDTDYTIIGMYDFDNNIARGWIFTNATQSIPSVEPAAHAQITDGDPGRINRVRVESGSGTVVTRWDEIRLATSWEDLLQLPATYEWDAGGGAGSRDWSNATNWTRNTEPGSGNSAFINGGFTGVVSAAGERAGELFVGSTNMPSHGGNKTGTLEQTGGDLVVSTNLTIGKWSTGLGTYLMTGGSLSVSNALLVGDHGRGFMTVTNSSTVWVGRDLSVGNSSGAAEDNGSIFTVGGGSVYVGDELRVAGTAGSGNGADGTVNMYGGLLQVTNQLLVADHGSSTGVFNLVGGRLNALGELVIIDSASGVGLFRQSGGTSDVAGIIRVGDGTGGDAQLVFTGGVFNAANVVHIADIASTRGSLVVSGGVFNANNNVNIGESGSGTGTFTMAAGNMLVHSILRVGDLGIGTMNMSAGSITANYFRVSYGSTATGTVTISGGRLVVTNAGTASVVFNRNGAVMNQSGGDVIVNGMEIGDVAGALGIINLSGGTLTVGNDNGAGSDLQLGNITGATGVVNVAGGILDLSRSQNDLRLGDAISSAGMLTMGGGTVTVSRTIYVAGADTARGEIYVTNGLLETTASELILAAGTGSTGIVVQTGGRVAAAGEVKILGASGTGLLAYYEISGGTLTNGDALQIGRDDGLGSGILRVVGSSPIIHVGDDNTSDFIVNPSGTLQLTFSNSAIANIQVSDDILLDAGSTLTISNYGGIVDGTYCVATSRNGSAVGSAGAFTTTNWLGSYTGVVTYAGNRILITFTTPSEIAVLGTDLAVIATGDLTPNTADGTDFGSVGLVGTTVDRTFSITNSGFGNLTISGVTTSGADAARFSVLSWPGIVSPLAVSNLVVRFDPTAVGLATAVLSIANNDSDENPYTFGIQGFGVAPSMTNFPTALNFASVLGSSPATQTFSITNVGLGSMTWALTTNVTWLSVSNVTGSAAAGAGQVHTAYVAMATGIAVGTSNATITVTSADATNSPLTIAVQWTISAIPNPTAQSATADGNEMVRLRWTKDVGYNVMVIHKGTNAPSIPANGTTYSNGHAFADGSRVVAFNSAVSALEHIVAPGSTNFYAFYSMNNSFYSAGVSASVTMGLYGAGEIVDVGAYTNGTAISTLNEGNGWSGGWVTTGSGTWVAQTNYSLGGGSDIPGLQSPVNYPSQKANRFTVSGLGNDQDAFARKTFTALTTGQVYIAGIIAYRFPANNKYMGISFMNGAVETGFVGKAGGGTVLAIDTYGGAKANGSTTMTATQTSTNNAYLVVAKYDFSTKQIQANAYLWTATVPTSEPGSWEATATVPGNGIAQIDGIRVGGGAFSGESIDSMWFDEVRVATNWTELLRLTQPVATAYAINGGVDVTDGQIVGGTYSTVFDFYDTAGITNTASLPNYDIWNSTGTRILTNQTFASKIANGGGATMRASNTTHLGASGAAVVLGVYTSRWTAANSNGVQVSNSDSLSNGTKTVFTVVDDDTAVPTIMATHSPEISTARNMHITTNGVGHAPDGGSTTNIRYSLTDGYLAGQISGGAPLIFYFGARDAGSGLSRGNGAAATNSSLTIGSAVISNTFNWDVTRSSAFTNTYDASATNSWSWIGALLPAEIDNLVTNTANGYGTNRVTLTWRDNDFDRSGDQSTLFDQQHGFLIVVDDDVVAPVITNNFRAMGRALNGGTFTNAEFSAGFWVTGSVADAFSGLFAGASNTMVVKYQDGTTVTSGIWSTTFANGGNGALTNTFLYSHFATPGIYTMAVTVVDYDIDRAGDSLSTSSNFVFTVVDAPNIPGLFVTPTTLTYTAMLGSSPAAAQIFAVTNVGASGTLIYTNSLTYGTGASGWLTVLPGTNSLAPTVGQLHTATVVSASFTAIGTYFATNLVAGNQTNAATNVVVTLTVTNIPSPTAVTATPSGAEFVAVRWTESSGRQVLIVSGQTNAPGVNPTNGSAYNVNDPLGSGTVVYKGTAGYFEQIVQPGSTNFYNLYAINNDRYSLITTVGATTTVYRVGEIVEPFSYTNSSALNGLSGGQGWTNAWNAGSGYGLSTSQFSAITGYPVDAGNVLTGTTVSAYREFAEYTSGKLYVSYKFRISNGSGYAGLSFFNNGAEQIFFGESGASANNFAVDGGSGNSQEGGSLNNDTDYTIIGMYDFDNNVAKGWIFTNATQSVPSAEPAAHAQITDADPTRINRVRVESGSGTVVTRWDEVRVSTNWTDLLNLERNAPFATNLLVNGGSDVTDQQVLDGNFGVRFHLRSIAGVESTNTLTPYFQPNFDLMNPLGAEILTDRVFSAFSYLDSGRTLVASNATHATVVPASITLGVYTARWSAVASNGNASVNIVALSNGTPQTFTVVDDDTTAPSMVSIYSPESGASRRMHLSTNGAAVSAVGGTSDTNITYVLFDNALTNISGASPLVIYFGARDAGSGLNRGNSSALTNSSLTIGSGVISNVFNWDSTRSSAFTNTYDASATSAWSWVGALLGTEIEGLVTNTTDGLGTNRVTVTWRDNDADRANDQSTLHDQQHGWLVVRDDDTDGPTYSGFNIYGIQGAYTVRVDELTAGLTWGITGRLTDAGSGVNVNGTETNQPNNSPYFELWDSAGNLKLRKTFATIPFGDGGATVLTTVSNGPVALSGVSVGIWTARVVAADNDEDRPNDRSISTNEFAFRVISGDAFGGIARGPASFVVTSFYGVVSGVAPWPVFAVTNVGSGTLNYSNAITYGSAGGWLSVAASDATLIGTGASQIHTAAVNAASLNPGTYTATITINGDQTNAAQTISVTLAVFGFYAGEIVDQFTNTVASSLHASTGGTGWTNTWSSSPSGGFSIDSGNHVVPGNYPAAVGNKVCGNSATEIQSYRGFPAFSTGKVFMAATIQKNANNNLGFAGLSFYNGSTEVGFIGKLFGQEWFGIDNTNGTFASTFGLYQNQYFIVGMYDFDNDVMYGRAYNSGETLSLTQPTSWHASNGTYTVSQITGIRIAGAAVGTLCFDELRVASSWEGLLNLFTNEPSVHSVGMTFQDVTTNSMTVSWTPGNGANRIVVAREGSPVTFSPTDTVAYAFNSDFSLAANLGSGNKVVYNGPGSTFALTGLGMATQYYFAVYEYNGAGSTANYYTNAGFATGSRWTLAPEPSSQATLFAAYQSSLTSISNTWTAAAGSPIPDGYLILRQLGSAPTNLPVDGVAYTNGQLLGTSTVATVVAPSGLETVLHTGLTSCTPYYFTMFAYQSAAPQFSAGFETTDRPGYVMPLQLHNAGGNTQTWNWSGSNIGVVSNNTTAYSGSQVLSVLRSTETGSQYWWTTKGTNGLSTITSGVARVTFAVKATNWTGGASSILEMWGLGSDQGASDSAGNKNDRNAWITLRADGSLVAYTNGSVTALTLATGLSVSNWNVIQLDLNLDSLRYDVAVNGARVGSQMSFYGSVTVDRLSSIQFKEYNNGTAAGGVFLDAIRVEQASALVSSQGESFNYRVSGALTSTASTACGEPSIQASNIVFSTVGTNLIQLSWENGNGEQRLLVVRGTNAINQDPVDGGIYTGAVNYGSGSHLGDGNYVAYIGTGTTATVTGLLSGVTYQFRVYEFNGIGGAQNYNTNTATLNPRSTATAAFGLVWEPFAYGSSFDNLSGKSGGTGWTNNWITTGGLIETGAGDFPDFKAYPDDGTSLSGFMDMNNGGGRDARRNFPAMSGGRMYVSIKMNDNHTMGASDYLGVDLLNGGVTTAFFGKASGVADLKLSLSYNGLSRTNKIDGTNTNGYQLNASTDYLLVAMYDFSTKEFKTRAYTANNLAHADPDAEDGWTVEMTNVTISRVDGIAVVASDNNQFVSFDSIRIGPSWEEVMWNLPDNWHRDNGPVPTLVYIGTNYGPAFYSQVITNLSDAELRDSGAIDFAVRWNSADSGIFLTNSTATNFNIGSPNARVSPNWDPLAVSNLLAGGGVTNSFNLDRYFTNYFGRNGDLVVTTYQVNAFSITNVNFDNQYFVTVSAEVEGPAGSTVTAPNGASWNNVPMNRAITINEPLRFYVYDDDTNAPVLGSARALMVMTNGVRAGVPQDFNGLDRYRVYDGVITQLGLQVSANIYDAYSGLQRSTSGTETTNLNITIDQFVTNNATAWASSLSSTLTTNTASTSVWSFASSMFTYGVVSTLWGGDGTDAQGQDLPVLVNAPDTDDDRANDVLTATNQLVGYIRVVDDDDQVPFATNTAYGGVSGSRLFAATTNSTPATVQDRGGTGVDVVYNLTDDELVNANTRNLRFAFGAIDTGSGLARGTSGNSNNVMNFSLIATNGNVLVANQVSHYDASQSSASAGAGLVITSVWSFTGSHIFNETLVNNMMTNGRVANTYVNTNRVTLTAVDADNDRTNDAEVAHDMPVGQITVRDDDRLAPNVGGMTVMGSGGIVVPSDLYISEYVEGSSNNKYIEIFNGTGGPVNLADYALGIYFNGGTAFTGVNNPAYMSGTLGNGATYILANDDAVIWGGTADQIIGATFNGNDAVMLIKKVGLVTNIIDVLGVIGENVNWLQDVTAVRRGSVTGPSSSWVSNDWAYLSQDILGGLGGHSAADPVTDGDLAAGGFVVLTGTVQDVTSGIYAQTGDPRAPRRSLKSNTGLTLLADGEFTHKPSSNGDAKTAEALWENALGAVNTNNVSLGIYTAVVSAVDYDIDRPTFGDNMTNSFPISFSVVDDDTAGPTAATNVTSTHAEWTNALGVTVRWSTNSVVDPSGVSLWRVSTNLPSDVTNGSLLAAGGTSTQGTFSLTIANEGITTSLLWAVDADGDRPLDQTYGATTGIVTKLDVTVPLALVGVSNDTTDASVDETEELKVGWTAGADEATVAGKRGDGTPLSPWSTYTVTYHELNDMGQELNTGSVTAANGPANLAVWNTTSMIISNLDFDSTYRIRIAGRDAAGNIGPETVVTGETVRFVVTQGLARVETTYSTSNQVDVYWLASSNKVYDVLYTDSMSLQDNLTNTWKLLTTVTNSYMNDNGGTGPDGDIRLGPALNQSTLRFYRVSRKDVWRTNNAVRRASVEVYAAKAIRLVPGENWVSLFATPDTSTVAYVLGTNRLVGGTSIVDSPKISWFTSTSGGTTNQSGVATSVIYFASSGNWVYWTGGVGSANQKLIPQNQGFLFELPPGSATQNMVIIGLVPTQEVVQIIGGGTEASNNIHVLSFTFPQRTRMKNAGFFGSGLIGHTTRGDIADEIRVLKNRNGIGSLEAPRGRFRLDTAGTNFVYYSGSPSANPLDYADGVLPGSANNFFIEPDDAVIVVRRNAGTMYWTNRPSYTPPGKNVNP